MLLDYLKITEKNKYDVLNVDHINNFVKKLKGYNWEKESSPLSAFGGMKGVKEARLLLLDHMGFIGHYKGVTL